jgi:Peptidase A4 family
MASAELSRRVEKWWASRPGARDSSMQRLRPLATLEELPMNSLIRASLVTVLAIVALVATSGSALAAGPIADRHKTAREDSQSTNWSGYAAYNTTFSHVRGDWTVPPANCSGVRGQQLRIAAAFVGLDGFLSNTVEQSGTDTDCIGNTAFYVAWYEFYPDRAVFLDQDVDQGDQMHAEVSRSGTTANLLLRNVTKNWTVTASQSSSSFDFSSAEWIMEAPTNRLTNFGSITFSNARATGDAVTDGPIGAFTNDRITMVTKNGRTTRATPDQLSSTTDDNFTVTFNHP